MTVLLCVLLAWLAVAAILAVVFGRVIRARDRREIPPPLDRPDDEQWRNAG
ncbi:hypothetical protein [Rhodococcus pyridinivorans]|uniref:hypothetical protein n=1 Tax=Rhodococcus pyridinivorans TaxID=103816 RepID=UPI0020788C1F|nr:hypothetical protein [Rhodococcus pyridinivorans]USI88397.1 hypothetical protein LLA01_12170 [Rhodococcus pyridinivorans]